MVRLSTRVTRGYLWPLSAPEVGPGSTEEREEARARGRLKSRFWRFRGPSGRARDISGSRGVVYPGFCNGWFDHSVHTAWHGTVLDPAGRDVDKLTIV